MAARRGRGALALAVPGAVAAPGDSEVSVGSPPSPFSQNKQNEPALAVDADHPNVLVAGANDNIDMEACNAGDDTTCPFTPGVGVSGRLLLVRRRRQLDPADLHGLDGARLPRRRARPDCAPHVGPIGTLPWLLRERPGLGRRPGARLRAAARTRTGFSWANGSRLYYANLTANFGAEARRDAFKGFEAIAVSRTDDVAARGGAATQSAWMRPGDRHEAVLDDVQRQGADLGRQRGQQPVLRQRLRLLAASAATARATRRRAAVVATSTRRRRHLDAEAGDAGREQPVNRARVRPLRLHRAHRQPRRGLRLLRISSPSACQAVVRTILVKSFDGGKTWTRPRARHAVDTCFALSSTAPGFRCVDGRRRRRPRRPARLAEHRHRQRRAHRRGRDRTDLRRWVDGRDGAQQRARARSATRPTAATTWSAPRRGRDGRATAATTPRRRSRPTARDAYLVYNAFTTPFRNDTTAPRGLVGVVKHADIDAGGARRRVLGAPPRRGRRPTRVERRTTSSLEFLGDYVYAVATRDLRGGRLERRPRRSRLPRDRRLAGGPDGDDRRRRADAGPAEGLPGHVRQHRHLRLDVGALAVPGEGGTAALPLLGCDRDDLREARRPRAGASCRRRSSLAKRRPSRSAGDEAVLGGRERVRHRLERPRQPEVELLPGAAAAPAVEGGLRAGRCRAPANGPGAAETNQQSGSPGRPRAPTCSGGRGPRRPAPSVSPPSRLQAAPPPAGSYARPGSVGCQASEWTSRWAPGRWSSQVSPPSVVASGRRARCRRGAGPHRAGSARSSGRATSTAAAGSSRSARDGSSRSAASSSPARRRAAPQSALGSQPA